MMRRSIVRFLIDENNKPSLILERMYPAHNKDVASKFITLLKKKTGNKFPILNCSLSFRNGTAKTYIPMTPVLASLEVAAQPYRDSGIEFKTLVSNRALFLENVKKQIEVIPGNYSYRARVAACKVRLSDLTDETDRAYWKAFRAGELPVYSIVTEATFLLRAKIDEAIKNVKDTNVKLPVITLQVFDSIFTNGAAAAIAMAVVEQFVKHSKRKPSAVFKGMMIENIKDALLKDIDKDRAKLVSKVEKIKGDKNLALPSDDIIRLIEKVS
eukprot:gnl/Spiro4/9952_TR5282_c0_g1_i1.p2 gnl/Spiro4/9952_TR5282_c0_g1~~gnl/Spiro4/9952_TR5282_c0_g1_i1.p2  ORF type:complete len:310 (+),score=6.32 gnl/Spiro4/9952_TR5282_c0_g1_i1:123-932(+)